MSKMKKGDILCHVSYIVNSSLSLPNMFEMIKKNMMENSENTIKMLKVYYKDEDNNNEIVKKTYPYIVIPSYFFCATCFRSSIPDKISNHAEDCGDFNNLWVNKEGKEEFSEIISGKNLKGNIFFSDIFQERGLKKTVKNDYILPKFVRNSIQISSNKLSITLSKRSMGDFKLNINFIPIENANQEYFDDINKIYFDGKLKYNNHEITYMQMHLKATKQFMFSKDIYINNVEIKFNQRSRKNILLFSTEEFDQERFNQFADLFEEFIENDDIHIAENFNCENYDKETTLKLKLATPKRCFDLRQKTNSPSIRRPKPYSFKGQVPTKNKVIKDEGIITNNGKIEPCSEEITVPESDYKRNINVSNQNTTQKIMFDNFSKQIKVKNFKQMKDIKNGIKKIRGRVQNKIIRRLLYGFPNQEFEEDKPENNDFVNVNDKWVDPKNSICYYDDDTPKRENRSYPGLIDIWKDKNKKKQLIGDFFDKLEDKSDINLDENKIFYFKVTKKEDKYIEISLENGEEINIKDNKTMKKLFVNKKIMNDIKKNRIYGFCLNYYTDLYNQMILLKYKPFNIIIPFTKKEEQGQGQDWESFYEENKGSSLFADF